MNVFLHQYTAKTDSAEYPDEKTRRTPETGGEPFYIPVDGVEATKNTTRECLEAST